MSDWIDKNVASALDALCVERDAAIARAEKAEQERDAAEKEALRADDAGRAATGALMDQIARAEAAEAQVDALKEALQAIADQEVRLANLTHAHMVEIARAALEPAHD